MDRTEVYKGKRVLLVEDDIFIGMDMADAIERVGGIVYGPITDRDNATKIASFGDIDCAIIDFNLGLRNSVKLAEFCSENNIPCVCYTGDSRAAHKANMQEFALVIEKPAKPTLVLEKLAVRMQDTSTSL